MGINAYYTRISRQIGMDAGRIVSGVIAGPMGCAGDFRGRDSGVDMIGVDPAGVDGRRRDSTADAVRDVAEDSPRDFRDGLRDANFRDVSRRDFGSDAVFDAARDYYDGPPLADASDGACFDFGFDAARDVREDGRSDGGDGRSARDAREGQPDGPDGASPVADSGMSDLTDAAAKGDAAFDARGDSSTYFDAGPEYLPESCVAEVARFDGRHVEQMSLSGENKIAAFGGFIHPKIFECDVSDENAARCELKAEIPQSISPPHNFDPRNFMLVRGRGWAAALVDDMSSPTPFDLVRFNIENTAGGSAYLFAGTKTMGSVNAAGSAIQFFNPQGLAYFEDAARGVGRWFLGGDTSLGGAVACFTDNGPGDWARDDAAVLTSGVNTTALGFATLDLGSGEARYLVALNSGWISSDDSYSGASVDVFDPSVPDTTRMRAIPLPGIMASRLNNIPIAGERAYVPIEAPEAAIAEVNLQTEEVRYIDLGDSLPERMSFKDMVVDETGGHAFLSSMFDDDFILRIELDRGGVQMLDLGGLSRGAMILAGGSLYAAVEPQTDFPPPPTILLRVKPCAFR